MKRLYFIILLTVSILLISILIGNSEILAQQTTITENVFVVIIDGLRNTEAFGDPTYQYIPNMGNILKPQGTLFNNVLNIGVTNTLPGHISILTGNWQQEPMYKGVKTRPLKPTIFEYYRKSKGLPQEQTWFVMGGKIEFLAYTDYSVHPLYGEPYKAYITTPISQEGTYKDEDVFVELQRVMDTYHPSLVVVNFGNVDGAGHTGEWNYYTSAIQNVDSIIYNLWLKIQFDPFYKDRTALLITTDHGRHSNNAGGFKDHGGICYGDKNLFLLALGPDFKVDTTVQKRVELIDIAPTIGYLLNFDTPFARGRILREMFKEGIITQYKHEINPKLSASSSGLHLVFEGENNDGAWQICYRKSNDGGKTWSVDFKISGNGMYGINPDIVSDGDYVHVVWQEYRNGNWGIFYRYSIDGGITWSSDIQLSYAKVEGPNSKTFGDIDSPWFPTLQIKDSNLYMVRTGQYYKLKAKNSSDNRLGWEEEIDIIDNFFSLSPDLAIDDSELHLVWAMHRQFNWEIYYKKSLDMGKSWIDDTNITNHPDYSYDPKITVNNYGIHVIWTDYRDSHPEIYYSNNLYGSGFSGNIRLTNSVGALHGDISSSPNSIYIVWENYNDGVGEIYAKRSSDGGTSWSRDIRVSHSDDNISASPSISVYNNAIYISWQENTSEGWKIKVINIYKYK